MIKCAKSWNNCIFPTCRVRKLWNLFSEGKNSVFFGHNEASLGTAWYKITGLILAKKINFTLGKKIFIPSCSWCVEKLHFVFSAKTREEKEKNISENLKYEKCIVYCLFQFLTKSNGFCLVFRNWLRFSDFALFLEIGLFLGICSVFKILLSLQDVDQLSGFCPAFTNLLSFQASRVLLIFREMLSF